MRLKAIDIERLENTSFATLVQPLAGIPDEPLVMASGNTCWVGCCEICSLCTDASQYLPNCMACSEGTVCTFGRFCCTGLTCHQDTDLATMLTVAEGTNDQQ